MITGIDKRVVATAADQAAAAAERSGIHICELSTTNEIDQLYALYAEIWQFDSERPLISVELLRALAKAGNYLVGAFEGGALLGASVGFFGSPVGGAELHSHMAGVSPHAQGRNVGIAMKLHQRAWALERGVSAIFWTADPLVRRNMYFNISKLGAEPVEYLPNFYGRMSDAINRGDDSDRISLRWQLAKPEVEAICWGSPRALTPGVPRVRPALSCANDHPVRSTCDDDLLSVAVPEDIEQLRSRSPEVARQWRLAVRDVLGGLMRRRYCVIRFQKRHGYILAAPGWRTKR